MMLRTCFLTMFFVSAAAVFAQVQPSSSKRLELVKVKQISTVEKIAALEQNIHQIESKILFIKKNPVLLREAENAGYLSELTKLKQISLNKLKLLQK